mmetsp:Transcript_19778/g.52586  ORF Transcript_19778/g.52586 Transcript_19778/m.52586 type:complete len:246 (-) Transcript_19778:758-1495(-)
MWRLPLVFAVRQREVDDAGVVARGWCGGLRRRAARGVEGDGVGLGFGGVGVVGGGSLCGGRAVVDFAALGGDGVEAAVGLEFDVVGVGEGDEGVGDELGDEELFRGEAGVFLATDRALEAQGLPAILEEVVEVEALDVGAVDAAGGSFDAAEGERALEGDLEAIDDHAVGAHGAEGLSFFELAELHGFGADGGDRDSLAAHAVEDVDHVLLDVSDNGLLGLDADDLDKEQKEARVGGARALLAAQ